MERLRAERRLTQTAHQVRTASATGCVPMPRCESTSLLVRSDLSHSSRVKPALERIASPAILMAGSSTRL